MFQSNQGPREAGYADQLYETLAQSIETEPFEWNVSNSTGLNIYRHIKTGYEIRAHPGDSEAEVIKPEKIETRNLEKRRLLYKACKGLKARQNDHLAFCMLQHFRSGDWTMLDWKNATMEQREAILECKGKVAIGINTLWFEDKDEAIQFKLKHGGESDEIK